MQMVYQGKVTEVNGECSVRCPNNMGGTCVAEDWMECKCKEGMEEPKGGSENV